MSGEQGPKKEPATERAQWFTEGVALAVATAGAYTCAYAYEAGFATRLAIPLDFVEVGVGSLVIAGLLVFGLFGWTTLILKLWNAPTPSFLSKIGRGGTVLAGLVVALLVGEAAWLLGIAVARGKLDFCARAGPPETVILRVYGDRAVAATFDRRAKRIGREIRVFPLDSETTLRCEDIGPLTKP